MLGIGSIVSLDISQLHFFNHVGTECHQYLKVVHLTLCPEQATQTGVHTIYIYLPVHSMMQRIFYAICLQLLVFNPPDGREHKWAKKYISPLSTTTSAATTSDV